MRQAIIHAIEATTATLTFIFAVWAALEITLEAVTAYVEVYGVYIHIDMSIH